MFDIRYFWRAATVYAIMLRRKKDAFHGFVGLRREDRERRTKILHREVIVKKPLSGQLVVFEDRILVRRVLHLRPANKLLRTRHVDDVPRHGQGGICRRNQNRRPNEEFAEERRVERRRLLRVRPRALLHFDRIRRHVLVRVVELEQSMAPLVRVLSTELWIPARRSTKTFHLVHPRLKVEAVHVRAHHGPGLLAPLPIGLSAPRRLAEGFRAFVRDQRSSRARFSQCARYSYVANVLGTRTQIQCRV